MSPRVKLPVLVVVALVLQTTLLASMNVAGVHADLLLLVTICAALTRGQEQGALLGFVCGLAADLFLQTPLGLSALTYALVGFAVGTVQGSILRTTFWIGPSTAFFASAAGVLLFGLIGAVVGQSQLVSAQLPVAVLGVAAFNSVLALLARPIVAWGTRGSG